MKIKESEYIDYGQDEDYPEDDPGNLLRTELSNISVGSKGFSAVRELLYTAEERNILENGVDFYDALTIYRIFVMATDMTKKELRQFRM